MKGFFIFIIEMKYNIEDIFQRKNGEITFIVFRSTYTNHDSIKIAESASTLAIK